MVEYSLFDKVKAVFDLVVASPLFLILFFGILLMMVDTLYISRRDPKTKKIYFGASLLIVSLFIYTYLDSLINIFDTLAHNIVTILYFPTVLEYIATLIISLIILFVSIFSSKIKPWLKRINVLSFTINAFLFFLILDQITSSEVDLTNKISIYTNSNLMMLLELSLFIFILWIIGLVLYKIIHLITPKEKNRELDPVNETVLKHQQNKEIPELKKEYVVIKGKNESDMFTLEEYRAMRTLLEIIKNHQKNETLSEDMPNK